MDPEVLKVAVLIDAENISYKYAQLILDEAGRIGNVVCRRIYGDWSSASMASWKQPIMDYSINAIQQFQNTSGKNSSDSALIIDAMDLMHEKKYQSICIVSSDSDFTRLANRLREAELYVVGMGEQKTPSSFKSSCDKFLYLDVLIKEEHISTDKDKSSETSKNKNVEPKLEKETAESGLNRESIIVAIKDIIEANSDEDGWIGLAELGSDLNRKFSDFDVRNFGRKKLSQFIIDLGLFELRSEPSQGNPVLKVVYVRTKQTNP